MEGLYETREVCKILELSSRRIINWVERDFIVPAQEGKGPGIRRKYSFENLIQMKLLKDLFEIGMRLSEAKKIISATFNSSNEIERWGNNSVYLEINRQNVYSEVTQLIRKISK